MVGHPSTIALSGRSENSGEAGSELGRKHHRIVAGSIPAVGKLTGTSNTDRKVCWQTKAKCWQYLVLLETLTLVWQS